MSIDDRGGGFLGRLRAVALVAVLAGAVGSVGFMLRAGHPPLFLRVLFAIWVLSPFVVLVMAERVSTRWSVLTREALYAVMLVIPLGTLVAYGVVALGPPRAQTAFVFVVTPPASWLVTAVVVPIAAVISGRLARRRDRQ
jgi:hypothetical protein